MMNLVSDSFFGASEATLLIHGGAWNIPDAETQAHVEGIQKAAKIGKDLLEKGDRAIHIAAAVVACLEDDPAFDAGIGAVLNQEREAELDAGIMCGATLRFGAVAGVKIIRNPIRTAAHVLAHEEGQVRLLVGRGAEKYAVKAGLDVVENDHFIVDREINRFQELNDRNRYHTSVSFLPDDYLSPGDTVGCVVLDRDGRLAAATSTGGTPYTVPGRVGDSPLPGAGFYANQYAAVSATGWGEAIAASACAVRVCDRIEGGETVDQAIENVLLRMQNDVKNPNGKGATGGLIAVDAHGNAAWACTTPRMARGGCKGDGSGVWAEV